MQSYEQSGSKASSVSSGGSNVIPFRVPQKNPSNYYDKQEIIDSLQIPYYSFDFKEWLELSKTDPELFEQRRKQVIEEFIAQCRENNKRRITGLQWRIEQERRLASSSLDSCIRIYNMMWEKVLGENGMLENIRMI